MSVWTTRTASLGPVGRWLAVAMPLCTAGCTILAPIQTPQEDRRFPLKFPTTEEVPCVNKATGESKLCTSELLDTVDEFHGGLGRTIWETDLRRRELVAQAAERTNLASAYNALLWPIGAFLIAKKIHHPEWSSLDALAFGTATYGFLGSGIQDRDKLYLKSATKMACVIVEFDAELYPKSQIVASNSSNQARKVTSSVEWEVERTPKGLSGQFEVYRDYLRQASPGEGASLSDRLNRLAQLTNEFSRRRDALLASIKISKPTPGLVGSNNVDQARLEAKGLTGSPKRAKDPTPDFMIETDTLLVAAEAQITAGVKLKSTLDTAGKRMRVQRSMIEGALTTALNDRTPALVSPLDRAREIAQAFEAGVAAEKGFTQRVTKQSGQRSTSGWQPVPSNLEGLTPESREKLLRFWRQDRTALLSAQNSLRDWTLAHEERKRQAKLDAAAMGCDSSLQDFASSLMKRMTDTVGTPPASGTSAPAP